IPRQRGPVRKVIRFITTDLSRVDHASFIEGGTRESHASLLDDFLQYTILRVTVCVPKPVTALGRGEINGLQHAGRRNNIEIGVTGVNATIERNVVAVCESS